MKYPPFLGAFAYGRVVEGRLVFTVDVGKHGVDVVADPGALSQQGVTGGDRSNVHYDNFSALQLLEDSVI